MKNRLLLINLGGPRNAEEIPKFLKDLFEDPLVFDLPIPEFLRIRLARKIAETRAKKVEETYASMGFGGGSPLVSETEKQAEGLKKLLEESGEKWEVKTAMCCGYPDIRELPSEWTDPKEGVVLLPLFPHFSRSTVLSTAMLMEKQLGYCPASNPNWVRPFSDRKEYLESIRDLILDFFQGKLSEKDFLHIDQKPIPDWQNLDIVFSAHGIPLRLIKKGDVYTKEIEENVNVLASLLKEKGYKGQIHLSYQSRVGPNKWTTPNTLDKIQELGQKGTKRVAVYPISFISDHLETLEEIGVQIRDHALQNGISEYYRIPAPGTYPAFLEALAKFVFEAKYSAQNGRQLSCICKVSGGWNPKKEKVTCDCYP
ncbi:ferrochelatase [Leptospira selangorensis]|uniref:Ferrochelatase n=1 Tax=Leptospira selangorensis TaxID=2484982 RepID=A0A5F2C368_9LEPT|nr:ferrochelatase [Leptospira selangorensis]TGM13353.1 ferrochelatase [Leptospira selangorensis]TGM22306.1 ferrochelatase [Leptospira selangorensis]